MTGQVLLISCPGSGKTTTMIRRVKAMIDHGIDASTILMVTFTDKAATEMKERFVKNYGQCRTTFCTIHSLCFHILKSQNQSIHIVSAEEQYRLLMESMRQLKISAQIAIKDIVSDISAYKNSLTPLNSFRPANIRHHEFCKIYNNYESKKQTSNLYDFDDLLCTCLELLTVNSDILKRYQEKYRYIICDEYQDTNPVQKEILYLLLGKDGNICVVGDDDQSIYGFRGSNPRIMMDFHKDYPNVHQIPMSTNYRSQPQIIEAANRLISHNTNRFSKAITSARTGNGTVHYQTLPNRQEEISFVAAEISRLILTGVPPSSIAVLSRVNQQLDDIATALEKQSISYLSSEYIRDIYEHYIFADIIAYLKLINGGWKSADLIRVLNKPCRYLKEYNFRTVSDFSLEVLLEAATSSHAGSYAVTQTIKLFKDIESLRYQTLSEQVQQIGDNIGYRKYLSDYAKLTKQTDDILLGKLDFFIEDAKNYSSLTDWYSAASAQVMQHRKSAKKKERIGVTLSTMHSAKGLEWDIIFIIDCCHGSIPSFSAKADAIEEERRLFYVAITRAREQVYFMNYSYKSTSKSKRSNVKESPFLAETKDNTITKKESDRKTIDLHSHSDFSEGDFRYFTTGMQVHHRIYGKGIVQSKSLFFISVRFDNEGIKVFPFSSN